jgi:hypothetical protein
VSILTNLGDFPLNSHLLKCLPWSIPGPGFSISILAWDRSGYSLPVKMMLLLSQLDSFLAVPKHPEKIRLSCTV